MRRSNDSPGKRRPTGDAPHSPVASRPAVRTAANVRAGLHPRNRHTGRYDFPRLTAECPGLRPYVIVMQDGSHSIDFSDPAAVRHLNRALLKTEYGIAHWDVPAGYLCPPVPGRADYLHGLADLLAETNGGEIPRGTAVRVLDIGTGANLIYPLLGHSEYGWRFVGTDIDSTALRAASEIVRANGLQGMIELRHQPAPARIFDGLLQAHERFDIVLCNPPFHASADDALRGSQRKWRNLGKHDAPRTATRLNFGGRGNELWCPGGEQAFVRRMIRESAAMPSQARWFSSLVAKSEHLADIRKQVQASGAQDLRVVAMAQGSKQSRFVAWTFLDAGERAAWRTTGPERTS